MARLSRAAIEEIKQLMRDFYGELQNEMGHRGRWQGNGVDILLGKTAEAIDKGATGTVDIYDNGGDVTVAAGSETANGEDVEAYNRFADLGSGVWVYVIHMFGRWHLFVAECE